MTTLRLAPKGLAAGMLLFGTVLTAGQDDARSLAGRWDGVVVANNVEVPFLFEIVAEGSVAARGRSSTASAASPRRARRSRTVSLVLHVRSVRRHARG